MTLEFLSSKESIGVKVHQCVHCRREIEIGARHHYTAQKLDGQFDTFREHMECRAAWQDLNSNLRDYPGDDGFPFLADDDDLDREWIEFAHPVVAGRLWPVRPVKGERQ